LAGLWAGTLVDRYHRGNLLVASLALRGLAAMLFLFPISMDNWLPIIYLVNFLLAILVQFEITIEAFCPT
jgi:MFS family permease